MVEPRPRFPRVRLRALDKKLLRELWGLRSQILSIALVVATGIMTVVTLRGGYESLVRAQESYYHTARFADVWASLERAPETLRNRIAEIPGVEVVDTRVTFIANLDLPDVDAPGMGLFVSVPSSGRPALNDIHLVWGRYPTLGAEDEAVVGEKFAAARGLASGDTLRAVINGRARDLVVVGAALSPEHSYAVPPGSLFPEDERYSVIWMPREIIGPAMDLDGAFNDVALRLSPHADTKAVISQLDDLLDPYGGLGAYDRDGQVSHQVLDGELDQNRVMGTTIPGIFLAVAAFLLNLVLGRLITTQRTSIAVLKAFGYTNREVGFHYLGYAGAAVIIGAVVGAVGGARLGDGYIALYGEYFGFPVLEHRLSPTLFIIATLVSVIAAVAGAMGAVRRAVKLPPAEAMRPAAPLRFRRGWLERVGFGRHMAPAGRMILRNIERRPVRTFLSSLGVAFSVAILIIGLFMYDGVSYMMDLQFRVAQREDLSVGFQRPLGGEVHHALASIDGVDRVETYRVAPVRLHAGHREREVGLQGVKPEMKLRRLVSGDGRIHPVPAEGIVISAMLADQLGTAPGERIWVEMLEGRKQMAPVTVVGSINDYLGLSAYMSDDALTRLTGEGGVVSGALLAVGPESRDAVSKTLKGSPVVASVTSPETLLQTFSDQLAESLFLTVGFLLGFAGVISAGVIYNGARTSLSERGRELASLRVMGFRRSEVAVLLLGEQAVVTAAAVPMGWGLGWILAWSIIQSIQTELWRLPFVISARTYAIAGLMTVVSAVASAWLVRRRVDRLDLISVLKTRE